MSAIGSLIKNVFEGVGRGIGGIIGGVLNLNPSHMPGGYGCGPSAFQASLAAQTLMSYGANQLMNPYPMNHHHYW